MSKRDKSLLQEQNRLREKKMKRKWEENYKTVINNRSNTWDAKNIHLSREEGDNYIC